MPHPFLLTLSAVQYYLPEPSNINKDFLMDVLAGKKLLMKKEDITFVKVPSYDELSVRRLWPQMQEDKKFMLYFPSSFPKDKGPSREYFFNILATLYPDYLKEIMSHASTQRMAADGVDAQEESIKISKFWEEELKAMPYLSRKSLSHLHS